jgi:hypothetical protein
MLHHHFTQFAGVIFITSTRSSKDEKDQHFSYRIPADGRLLGWPDR